MIKRYLGYLPVIVNRIKIDALNAYWVISRKLGNKNLIAHTKQGVFKVSTSDSVIGHCLFTLGDFEYSFSLKAIDFLKMHEFVRPDNITFLDIGANIGIISIGLLRQGAIAHAIAVEPEANNYKLLAENVRLNALSDKMVCLPFALGDLKAILKMEMSPDNPGDHRIQRLDSLTKVKLYSEDQREVFDVTSLPLDELILVPEVAQRNLSFENAVLWIDVQGYEGYVFKGAQKFLSNGAATVSEIWPYGILRAGMTLSEFTDIIASIWSDYWVLRGERFIRYPVAMFDRYLDELGDNDGYGNVIFTKKSKS